MINLAHVILYSQDATSTPGSGNCVRGAWGYPARSANSAGAG